MKEAPSTLARQHEQSSPVCEDTAKTNSPHKGILELPGPPAAR